MMGQVTGPVLAIVWHSRTGAAQAMAQSAEAGAIAAAREDGDVHSAARVRLLHARDATPDLLLAASGYLFVCPENLGTMSGMMKDMFDRTYYPLLGQVAGRPYATAIAAGSDGRGAEAQLVRIVTGWRLRRVAEPLIIRLAAQTEAAILASKTVAPADLKQCHDVGFTLMSGMMLRIF